MFLKWRKCSQSSLDTLFIVVANVGHYHMYQLLLVGELPAIVALPLQYAPEAFHRPVVDAVSYSGHALLHACFFQLAVKGPVCVLEPPVAVK